MKAASSSGLDGVVAAETELSDVDGELGKLVIRGYSVEDLVARSTFEDVCALMWSGALPAPAEREQMRVGLAQARLAAWELLPSLGNALSAKDGMEALRAATAHLSAPADFREGALRLTGAMVVFNAAWARTREGKAPVKPRPELSHAADYLQMLTGMAPEAPRIAGMDAYLCCVVDHGMNASTFVARVIASTGSDLVSAIVGAIGALKGPLHGGAPGPVLDMLDAIGTSAGAQAWLEKEIAAGQRIMGMGHRIYRVRDPRAAALERAATVFEKTDVATERLKLARAVEHEAERQLAARHPERSLRANVEFYTAVLLEAVGIPRELFSPTFAASRVVGWCAHVAEQRRVGRLIRPASKYVGPMPS